MAKINETTKIIAKTGPTGEMDFEKVDADVAQKLNGQTVTDPKGNRHIIKDTGKTISEEDINQTDFTQLGKQLGSSVAASLRDHGDEMDRIVLKNIKPTGCTIHIEYKQDEEDIQPQIDDFNFEYTPDGKVTLDGKEIAPISQISGNATVQKDLVKDAVMQFIKGKDNPMQDKVAPEMQECDAMPAEGTMDEDLLLGFSNAVDTYRKNPKDKEAIKELFRQSRNFDGDTIQQKFKNAVTSYLMSNEQPESTEMVAVEEPIQDEPQVVSPQDDRVEGQSCCNEGDLCLDMSLFIRLLEYAHEDAKEDVDLHFVAENLQDVCKSKGCATMRDYELIINSQNGADRESDAIKPEEEMDESIYNVDPDLDGFLCWCRDAGISPDTPGAREEYEDELEYLSEASFMDPINM